MLPAAWKDPHRRLCGGGGGEVGSNAWTMRGLGTDANKGRRDGAGERAGADEDDADAPALAPARPQNPQELAFDAQVYWEWFVAMPDLWVSSGFVVC